MWINPHLKIILEDGGHYLYRWHLIPRNKWFNVYLHKTMLDDHRVLHDHPWDNISIVLKGGYWETTPIKKEIQHDVYYNGHLIKWRHPGSIIRRKAEWSHRLSLFNGRPSWSLFITFRERRNWGFHTKYGWKPHTDLIVMKDGISRMTKEGREMIE